MGGVKKAPAPDDLPVFIESQKKEDRKSKEEMRNVEESADEQSGSFVDEKEHEEFVKEVEKVEQKEEMVDPDMEPTDDEVKDRLNKLLKGEL
jgi:hypothetical protein